MADEPREDSLTGEDDFDPKDLKSARPWLAAILSWEKHMSTYNAKCDKIDKQYADLERLGSQTRDKEMSLFWANMSVLGPSIYARPPVPVVTVRFKDRDPVKRIASELLERSAIVSYELTDVDGIMKLLRDDLARLNRAVIWQRYETKDKTAKRRSQKAAVDYKNRRDFLHDPARNWMEVDCVAAASYLSRTEMRKRFSEFSGKEYQNAAYAVRKDDNVDHGDTRLKAKVWEIWCKSRRKVVWVAEGCENCLEIADPHLDLDCFFPCPKPAYGTVQPNTLIPVPDYVQYQDQLGEINDLTARISALTEAVKLRAFYPAGVGEIGDAIETAIKNTSDNVVMVGVSNWAMLGQGKATDMLVWLPLEMVTATIAQLVELRRQIIQDVYEISGISDILRGQTDPNETLGAQELKAQTGSVRIRDKQQEMVRLARDMTRINAEIMAENFSADTLLDMSQMEIPKKSEIDKQIAALEKQGKALKAAVEAEMAKPEIQAMAQEKPEEAQQALQEAEQQAQQLQGQIAQLKETVTIEQVMEFLRDQRIRPFVLDIETDSTIVPDENAAKRQATEYVGAMTQLFAQLIPAVQQTPQLAPIAAETINYVNGVFRVGRQFEGVVDEFTDQMKQLAAQPRPEQPNPDVIKAQAEAKATEQRMQIDAETATANNQKTMAEAAEKAANAERVTVENAERGQALQAKAQQEAFDAETKTMQRDQDLAAKQALSDIQVAAANESRANAAQKHQQDMDKGALDIALTNTKIEQAKVATDNSVIAAQAAAKAKTATPTKPKG